MAEGTGRGESLSIWFFVGIMTLAYGLVLLPYGAWAWLGDHYSLLHGPQDSGTSLLLRGHEAPTVLHELHPTFWWGLLLTGFGAFYTLKYKPKPEDKNRV